MAGSIFKRTSHLRAFVTDDEAPANVRRRRAVKMPRTLVPTPVVPPAAATTPSAAGTPATTPRPARRRAPKPTTEEAE
jgi:hypothetical protein